MIAKHIIECICNELGLTKKLLYSKSRKAIVIDGKQTVAFALNYLGFTQKNIAEVIGYADHTTVNHLLNNKKRNRSRNRFIAIKAVEAYLPIALYKVGLLREKYEAVFDEED